VSAVELRATVLAATVLVSACTAGTDHADSAKIKQTLRPHFAPATTSSSTPGAAPTSTVVLTVPSSSVPPRSTTETVVSVSGAPAAQLTDPAGDVSTSLERPPAWADLLGATLVRSSSGFELRVHLAGGKAPSSSDADHTMNLASFYDVDGDGTIDYEVWANVASGGWGSSYFDDVHHGGGYQEKSGVTVTPEGDEVVLRFPSSHLGGSTTFRWSIASEWGRYDALGTLATARDAAPDNPDDAADFPGR
jgi:hypothetical protein